MTILQLRRLFVLPFSILLLLLSYVFSTFVYRKKIYSVYFSYKYFGHSAIESAIASSFVNTNDIKLFSSHHKLAHGDNVLLHNISRSLFDDCWLPLNYIQFIFNNSFSFIQELISLYYSPLFPSRVDRELFYLPYLSTDLSFPWRSLISEHITDLSCSSQPFSSLPVLIAVRTSHFHSYSPSVSSQNYRNLDLSEIEYLLNSFLLGDHVTTYILYASISIIDHLKSIFTHYCDRIEYVDQSKNNIIPLFARSKLLVNNGNGIGAFALSLGFPTLYVKHSPFQCWHSSHLNSIAIPPIYVSSDNYHTNFSESVSLAFSTDCILPLDFYQSYSSRNVFLLPLTSYPSSIFSSSLTQALDLNSLFLNKSRTDCLVHRLTNTKLNSSFWAAFNSLAPNQVKIWHRKQYLTISSSFLSFFS